jgi:hypothetical protein
LKYPDAILATYNRRQMKNLKHASETFVKKTCEKHLKTIAAHTPSRKILATYATSR